MPSAVIIGAGVFPKKAYPLALLKAAGRVVVCDGALRAYLRAAEPLFGAPRPPDAIVGDMDSLPASLQKRYAHLIHEVEEQDDNDQTKALHFVLENYPEVDEITFLGATGKREDHTIGNMSLLMEYLREGVKVRLQMVSDYSSIFAIGDSCSLYVGQGRRVSLFSPDNKLTIKSKGLVWPTDGVVFDNWWKATLNRASEDHIDLHFSHPSIALIVLD